MQFMLVNELLTQEKCGLRGASKLFISMVELYKSDRTKFQEILMEAKKTVEVNKTNQEKFTAWLSCRLSPAQMSEIYITYYDIDKYLQKEKILETPVLETMDLNKIESIRKMIMTNGKFRFIHRVKVEKYSKAIGYYHEWLSEYYKKFEMLKKPIEKEEKNNIRIFETEDKSLDIDKQSECTKESDGIKLVKFGAGESYSFTKVEFFEYFGKRHDNIGSWKKLYVKVLQCLVEDYPDEINNLKGKSIGSGTRIDIGNWEHSLSMAAPRMFETNLYVETNLNATNILDKIKHLLDLCRIDAENLVVAYSMKDNENKEKVTDYKLEELETEESQKNETEPDGPAADRKVSGKKTRTGEMIMNENPAYKSGFATLIGRPNVGKSTLMNRLIGQKIASTSNKPQTTRNRIQTVLTLEEGQIVFLDTPGIHKAKNKLGDYMVNVAEHTLNDVAVILWLVEPTNFIGAGERHIIEQLKKTKTPVILVINKTDTVKKEEILAFIDTYRKELDFQEIVPVSALKGDNTDVLIQCILKYLPYGPAFYDEDTITDQPMRQIVAELIREKALRLLSEEIPHGIAVTVESMKERGRICDIEATIICERDSHKGIIIGKGGQMLKKIGSQARPEIEDMLEMTVNLQLWVKVKKDWRDSDILLKNFGYNPKDIEMGE